MEHNIAYYAKKRYSAKAFDKTKKVSADKIETIKELLRYNASSTNVQPWHFIIASSDEGKAKVAKSADGIFTFNRDAIINASHVAVFCSRTSLDDDFLLHILDQEEKDGRFLTPEFKEQMHQGRSGFINIHKNDLKDVDHWIDKQLYLSVGAFLLGVSTLGIDAVPMEGFVSPILDKEFGLNDKGYSSRVIVPFGYSDPENDYNAKLPKSRLPYSEILTEA